MNKKFKLTDKVTKESIRSPEFKRWLKLVLAAVCIFSLIFQLSMCAFTGLKVSAAAPGDTVLIELVPSLPSSALTDMDAVFDSNGTTYYGITINSSGITFYDSSDLPTIVYSNLTWTNNSYRTITIIQMAFNPLFWITQNSVVLDSISIIGTWVLNNNFTCSAGYGFYDVTGTYYINSNYNGEFTRFGVGYFNPNETRSNTLSLITDVYNYISSGTSSNKTIIFTGGEDINNLSLKSWLIQNAVKQAPPTVHDFTNEIRQFNDNLTFYNTTSASWYETFSFDFEVIGVGTADTLILERDVNNYYTMSYNYNIDGVTTLQDVYSFHYPTQSGGFIRDNYKLIRFITNPDNTDFQQWLLDNTTLVGTVDDAPTFDSIYETGFNVGYNAGYEQGFANSLIGDSLSGPINALSSITLIQIGDVEITLGGVVMTAIALCLVLAFLKLYAGG